MTCCDSIVHICLLLLSVVLLSLSISTLIMTGQVISSPNTSAQYIFSATIIGAASLMFVISLINIVFSCRRAPESEITMHQRAASGSVAPISCSVILVLLISIIVIALTSILLSPDYSSTKMPIWYTASLLGISLLTLAVSIAVIATSSSCCVVRAIDNERSQQDFPMNTAAAGIHTSTMLQSGVQSKV